MRAPRHILLLDVMSTLVHDPFYVEVPAFFGLTLAELHAQKHPTAWLEFEVSAMDEAEFLRRFFRDGRPVDGPGLKATMQAAYRWLDGVEPILAELHRLGVELHALSNYPVWYKLIEERLALSRYLSWRFVSCKTGVRKPDEVAYRGAAAALGVSPSRCLFVDDREPNCAAAEATGMEALRFTDAAALRQGLEERGLFVDPATR